MDEERHESAYRKKNGTDDGRVKSEFLKAAPGVVGRAEVVAKGATHTRAGLLDKNTGNHKDRERYLNIGQNPRENLHSGKSSREEVNRQED